LLFRYLRTSQVPSDISIKVREPNTVDNTMIRFLWLTSPPFPDAVGACGETCAGEAFDTPSTPGTVVAVESEVVESERIVFEVHVGIMESVVVCVIGVEDREVLFAVTEVSTNVVSVTTECASVGEPSLLRSGTLTGPAFGAGCAFDGASKLKRHAIANCVPFMSVNSVRELVSKRKSKW
jgi:hypothetical protein